MEDGPESEIYLRFNYQALKEYQNTPNISEGQTLVYQRYFRVSSIGNGD
jgi:hypothetical protein